MIDSALSVVQAGMGRVNGDTFGQSLYYAALLVSKVADLLKRLEQKGMMRDDHLAAFLCGLVDYGLGNIKAYKDFAYFVV